MSEQERMAANMLIRAIIESLNERLGENGAKIIFWKVGLTHLFDTPLKNYL